METYWPPSLESLLTLTAKRTKGRDVMYKRFPCLIKPYLDSFINRPVIRVAGTNGKGSLCAMLEACLTYEGLRPGLFTSPHLQRVTERFRVAGIEVSAEMLDRHAENALRIVREQVAKHGESHRPSFFESLILIAMLLFHEQQVDVAIFEAGVGGRSDATSFLPGEFSVITTIGLDHQQHLGNSLEAIAADKAGIASVNGQHLILGPQISPSLRKIIEKEVRPREVKVSQAHLEGLYFHSAGLHHETIIEVSTRDILQYRLPLLGRHQVSNFATLQEVVKIMANEGMVRDTSCLEGVANTRWRGRLEVRKGEPCYVIDAAHNEAGILALIDSLADLVPYSERILLYGASAEKDYGACLKHLPQLAPDIFMVEGFYRAEKTNVLKKILPTGTECVKSFATPGEAFGFLSSNHSFHGKVVVVTGSIFMIGDFMGCLDSKRSAKTIEPEVRDDG